MTTFSLPHPSSALSPGLFHQPQIPDRDSLLHGLAHVVQRERFAGTIQDVLVEEEGFGRTRGNAKVTIDGPARIGETVRVRIGKAVKTTFEGVVVSAAENL